MLKNYILVAIRNLTKHRFFSALNIFGLAVSISVCLGIIMLVADQLQYDRYNTNGSRIYRINTQPVKPDGTPASNLTATSPLPLAPELLNNFTGTEKIVRIRRGFGNNWLEFEKDITIPLSGFFADPEFLEMFQYELLYGNPKTALTEPHSVVLTYDAAKKLFNQENPVGEVITVGKLGEYKVTGVLKDSKKKSHIVFEALASFSTLKGLEQLGTLDASSENWDNYYSGWVYVMLNENQSSSEIQAHLQQISTKYRPSKYMDEERLYSFALQNLFEITPGPLINNAIGPFMPLIFIYFFAGLALVVVLASCFNYTNLSIARSLSRAREIGVRKVSGASRSQIFAQFMVEAIALSLVALVVAVLLLILVKPFLLNLKFAQILHWDMAANPTVFAVFVVFTILIGLLAGSFPAIVLSRFQPVTVLKKVGTLKLFSHLNIRKALLVFQFSLSLIFIISVTLLSNQLHLFLNKDHGFDMTGKLVVKLNSASQQSLKNELVQHPGITNCSAASHLPAIGVTYGEDFKKEIGSPEGIDFNYFNVDENYLENMSLKLVSGRFFTEEDQDKKVIVVNENAVKKLSFSDPTAAIGEVIYNARDSASYEIIGVVKDYNSQALISQIQPVALHFPAEGFNLLQVAYSGDRSSAAKTLETAWSKINPNQKIDYKDMETEIKEFYQMVFSDFVKIVGVLSVIAIVISCLGLLGIAAYTMETKMKEIAIRKILGSSIQALVFNLSRGFLVVIAIAILIATPLAWFINHLWLDEMAYKTEFGIGVLLFSISFLLILALLTVGSQSLRATFTNPLDSIKNE